MRNNLSLRVGAAFLALLACVSTLRADASIIAPYVTEQSFLVMRMDLSKMNAPAITDWVAGSLERAKAPADLMAEYRKDAGPGAKKAQEKIDQLTAAGIKEVFIVMTLDQMQPHPVFIFAKPTKPEAIEEALGEMRMQLVEEGDVYVATDPQYANAIKTNKPIPAAREDLVGPIKNATNALTINLAPSEAHRAMLAGMVPNLPPEMGGDPITVLTDGIRQLTISLDTPPNVSAAYSIKSKDAASAQAFKAYLDKQAEKAPAEGTEIMKQLTPTLNGDTFSLTMKEKEIDQVVATALPAMLEARKAAVRTKSMSNLRQQSMALIMYANDNQGAVPPTLDAALKSAELEGAEVLINPLQPDLGDKGYVYVVPAEGKLADIKNPGERIAIYEAGPFGKGKNAAFWDGHVEFVTDEAKFNEMLKAK